MWYTVRCVVKQNAFDLSHTFTYTYERMRKYEGSWHVEIIEMFPEHRFLEGYPFGTENGFWQKLSEKEEEFLRKLFGKEHHLKMLRGYILDGVLHIVYGPLKGMEKSIRKIDRHKRLAYLKKPQGKLGETVLAGLEIVYKSNGIEYERNQRITVRE